MPPLDTAQADDWITAPAAQAAGKDDWITAPKAAEALSTPYSPDSIPAPMAEMPRGQSQVAADINAPLQGLVGGVGAGIAGAGRAAQAAGIQGTKAQLAVMDAIDRGDKVPQDQDTIGYQFLSPEQRAKAREQFTSANDELSKREPNAAIRAGEAIKSAAGEAFPVAPENEGIQTGVGRLIGGAAPAIAAGSAGGPAGVLASLAVIGSQAYDSAYHDAVAKGASPEDAENAAGKSAVVQAATMVAPIGRLLQRVPMPLRDGLMKTLVNLGQNGVEFGSANALGTFANNYVAQQTYDPSRALTQGTGQAGLEGTIAGLVIPAAVGAVRTVRSAGEIATDVMKAPDIDGAIAAATREAGAAPGEIAAPAPAGDLFAPKPDAALAGQPDQTGAMTPLDWNRLFALRPEAPAERPAATMPETIETPTTVGADPLYESVPKQPMRLAEWLRRPTTQFPGTAQETRIPGGIQDTGGDIEAILGGKNQRIGLINKNGRPQNEAAQAAWEAGYFPEFGPDQVPNESDLQDALRDDVNGVPRYSIHDDQDVSAYTRAVENNAEIGRLSANYDVDPKGMTRQQFYAAVRQKMTPEEFANEQQSLDTAHAESYAAMDRSARQDIPDSGLSAIYDQSQVRSVEDLEREYQQEIAATEARERAGATAPAGRERQDAASGQAGQGSDGSALGLAGRAATSGSDLTTQAVGAAASRDGTAPGLIAMSPADAAANRAQGEVERFAAPPRANDTTIYIPGTKPTLAEVTGDPRVAMDQAYNRQQPEAMQAHTEQENHNSDAVADYYADTAGSAQTLARMERARDERAQRNIQRVFGDPQSQRPPADPTDVIQFMDETLADPRMQERDIIRKTLPNLIDRFYNDDGSLKTDPLSLYGIRQHIQDLLNGAGDPETNAAARMLRRELMQIQSRLDDVIEQAAPGFGQYRADYTSDSREIDAMRLLQGERLALLNKDMHITPAKWFSFMKGIIEGRTDPMDPASALSEDQMDRLWNITDQLKRQTFIDAGKPRGSWTSMMQEWGGRFARVAAHGIAISHFPVVGNLGVEMGVASLRRRNVNKEMNRVLNPDLGQSAQP